MSRFLSHVAWLHSDFQIKCDNMMFFTAMKAKIKHTVDSSYGFDASQAPNSTTSRVQALLAEATFIYQVRFITLAFAAKLRTISVNRNSTLGNVHDIHINTPVSRKLSTSCGSTAGMTLGLSFMNTSVPSHSKLLPLQPRW